ncbi:MAG: hypothetical protein M3N43_05180, partial [Actinomycetota bacterium]|nr:hypothetical protein [Actinomycetota bacterium]
MTGANTVSVPAFAGLEKLSELRRVHIVEPAQLQDAGAEVLTQQVFRRDIVLHHFGQGLAGLLGHLDILAETLVTGEPGVHVGLALGDGFLNRRRELVELGLRGNGPAGRGRCLRGGNGLCLGDGLR